MALEIGLNLARNAAGTFVQTTRKYLQDEFTRTSVSSCSSEKTLLFCVSFLNVLSGAAAGYTAVLVGGALSIHIAVLTSGPIAGGATYLVTSQRLPAASSLIVGIWIAVYTAGTIRSSVGAFVSAVVAILTIIVGVFAISRLNRVGVLVVTLQVFLAVYVMTYAVGSILNYEVYYGNVSGACITAGIAGVVSYEASEITGRTKTTMIGSFVTTMLSCVFICLAVAVLVSFFGSLLGIFVGASSGYALSRVKGTFEKVCILTSLSIICRLIGVI